jgi:hypothetical protein
VKFCSHFCAVSRLCKTGKKIIKSMIIKELEIKIKKRHGFGIEIIQLALNPGRGSRLGKGNVLCAG